MLLYHHLKQLLVYTCYHEKNYLIGFFNYPQFSMNAYLYHVYRIYIIITHKQNIYGIIRQLISIVIEHVIFKTLEQASILSSYTHVIMRSNRFLSIIHSSSLRLFFTCKLLSHTNKYEN